jgi:hypothetical protein
MGFFNIIETFFFISLGITIILVALLVYHFKQRLSLVEQKYESLFDIVAGVVKQLSNIQSAVPPPQSIDQFGGIYQRWTSPEHLGNITVSTEYPDQMFHTMREQYSYNNLPVQSEPTKNNNNVEVDSDSCDESDESDDSDDSIDSESELNDSDEDSEVDEHDIDENDFSKIIVSDDEPACNQNSSVDSVKIISLPVGETQHNIEELDITPINLDDSQDIDDTYESPVQDVQIDYSLTTDQEETPVVVRKIDDIQNEPTEPTFVIERSSAKDLYKKMSLSNLKATVISKGLCSDPSKMKKNELLKLLEDE